MILYAQLVWRRIACNDICVCVFVCV